MTLIVLSLAILLVVESAVWFAIKRLRAVPNGDELPKSSEYREAVWWLAATIVVLILLGFLTSSIYRAQRTPAEVILTMEPSITF